MHVYVKLREKPAITFSEQIKRGKGKGLASSSEIIIFNVSIISRERGFVSK